MTYFTAKQIRILVLVGFSLLANQALHAQWFFGIEAGSNKTYLISNTSDKAFFEYQPRYGFSASATARYQFKSIASWFGGIQIAPGFVRKNYIAQRTGFYAAQYQKSFNSYIELPVMANFHFGGYLGKKQTQTLHGFLNLGFFTGYWMSGRVIGRQPSPLDPTNLQRYDESYTFNSTRDNRIEWGVLTGLGLKYQPYKGYLLTMEGRYTPLLSDIQKKYQMNQSPKYYDTFTLLVGIQFSLDAIKHNFFSFKRESTKQEN